jgi:hypothetical protein
MGKPPFSMSKLTFYFSHDYNARNDEKIKLLIRRHGMIGYGIYWSIVEDLYHNANALRTDYDGIAFDLRAQCDIVRSVVEDFGLFEISENFFGSKSVQRRLDEVNSKSAKARESASYRWGNANALRALTDRNAINKIKEINEIKESNLVTKEFSKKELKEKEKINKKEKEKQERKTLPRIPKPKKVGMYVLPKLKVVVFDDETCQPMTEEEFALWAKKEIRPYHIEAVPELLKPLSEVDPET